MDLRNYIGGKFVYHSGDEWMNVLEPATGQRFARVPLSTCLLYTSDAADE